MASLASDNSIEQGPCTTQKLCRSTGPEPPAVRYQIATIRTLTPFGSVRQAAAAATQGLAEHKNWGKWKGRALWQVGAKCIYIQTRRNTVHSFKSDTRLQAEPHRQAALPAARCHF